MHSIPHLIKENQGEPLISNGEPAQLPPGEAGGRAMAISPVITAESSGQHGQSQQLLCLQGHFEVSCEPNEFALLSFKFKEIKMGSS